MVAQPELQASHIHPVFTDGFFKAIPKNLLKKNSYGPVVTGGVRHQLCLLGPPSDVFVGEQKPQ